MEPDRHSGHDVWQEAALPRDTHAFQGRHRLEHPRGPAKDPGRAGHPLEGTRPQLQAEVDLRPRREGNPMASGAS